MPPGLTGLALLCAGMYKCRERQGADSDSGFTGGRQRPQVAGDAGLVTNFNCSALSGMACAEGGVETVIQCTGMYKCRVRQDAGSELSSSHVVCIGHMI